MKNHLRLFKTLSDETRLRILLLLYAEGELCVCAIIAALLLPQSTISRHLASLKKSAAVNARRQGLWIYYSINRDNRLMTEIEPFLQKSLEASAPALRDRQRLREEGSGEKCPPELLPTITTRENSTRIF